MRLKRVVKIFFSLLSKACKNRAFGFFRVVLRSFSPRVDLIISVSNLKILVQAVEKLCINHSLYKKL